MTDTLVLRLAAPQQSWGIEGTAEYRTTELVPTRSGLEGFFAAALGAARGQHPSWLGDLDVTVRVDRPGTVERDFHTITGPDRALREARAHTHEVAGRSGDADWVVPRGDGKAWKVAGVVNAAITHRYYLADAEFTVAVSGPVARLDELEGALRAPKFVPYLGRKAFAPTFPMLLGRHTGDHADVLTEVPSSAVGPLRIHRITGARNPAIGRVTPQVSA